MITGTQCPIAPSALHRPLPIADAYALRSDNVVFHPMNHRNIRHRHAGITPQFAADVRAVGQIAAHRSTANSQIPIAT